MATEDDVRAKLQAEGLDLMKTPPSTCSSWEVPRAINQISVSRNYMEPMHGHGCGGRTPSTLELRGNLIPTCCAAPPTHLSVSGSPNAYSEARQCWEAGIGSSGGRARDAP
eukprot:4682819-Prymnesium_polylepis.1